MRFENQLHLLQLKYCPLRPSLTPKGEYSLAQMALKGRSTFTVETHSQSKSLPRGNKLLPITSMKPERPPPPKFDLTPSTPEDEPVTISSDLRV